MGRAYHRLSARGVQTLTVPGRYADGGGLYLVVEQGGSKRWIVLYRFGGRRRELGLGGVRSVSLARARELAAEAHAQIAAGIDPIEARRQAAPPTIRTVPTFGAVAKVYMADRESTWRNAVHRRQWRQTLEVQAAAIWTSSVDAVDTDLVLAVLRPLWSEKPETARRMRGRIERVLDAARVTDTNETPCASNSSTRLAKSASERVRRSTL